MSGNAACVDRCYLTRAESGSTVTSLGNDLLNSLGLLQEIKRCDLYCMRKCMNGHGRQDDLTGACWKRTASTTSQEFPRAFEV